VFVPKSNWYAAPAAPPTTVRDGDETKSDSTEAVAPEKAK